MSHGIVISESEKRHILSLYEQSSTDEVYSFVNVTNRPVFPGCENIGNEDERFNCFNTKIRKYISENIKIPQTARDNKIMGKVWTGFIIEKNGTISNVSIERGVDKSLDDEAIYQIYNLPAMLPAKVNGFPVRMSYTIPINFRDDYPTQTKEDEEERKKLLQLVKNKEGLAAQERQRMEDEIQKAKEELDKQRAENEKQRIEDERTLYETLNKSLLPFNGKTVNLYNDSNQQVLWGKIKIEKMEFYDRTSFGERSGIKISTDLGNYEIICLSNPNRLSNYLVEEGKYTTDLKYNKGFTDAVISKAPNFCKKPSADFAMNTNTKTQSIS